MKQMPPDIKQIILANMNAKLYSYTLWHYAIYIFMQCINLEGWL